MKTSSIAFALLLSGIASLQAGQALNGVKSPVNPVQGKKLPEPTAPTIVAQDANSRVWEQTVYELDPSGQPFPKKHSYTEMALGLNYLVKGRWVESSERIDILPNGTAVATNGQHMAYFPGDIYNGQIELVTPDGQHLKSRPLGLSYFDGEKSVLIAELTNSVGVIVGENKVIYPNAFTDFKVDLRYTYTKAGFEQDIILRQQPPTPESLGLNPDTARLEVLTEFFDPPQPKIQTKKLPAQAGLSLTDESLAFGAMHVIPGRAFLMGNEAKKAGAKVAKDWRLLDGRQFLVEAVPVDAILEDLVKLPLTAMNKGSQKNMHAASHKLTLPSPRMAKNNPTKMILLASDELPQQGFVLDYQTLTSTLTDFTFRGDTTYYVSGYVGFDGASCTIEGGSVIKFAPGSGLDLFTPLACNTSPYRPAVLTAVDDDTVGETISGISTGNPIGNYADFAIGMEYGTSLTPVQNLRISYADIGLGCNTNVLNCQFVNVGKAIFAGQNLAVANVLLNNVGTGFYNNGFTVKANFVTVHHITTLSSSGNLNITNSLLICVTNFGSSVTGGYNYTNSSDAGIFQTIGGGSHYLATNSPCRNVGTTNISSETLADIARKTTYPPIIYSDFTFTAVQMFSPQAQRDADVPDLGYHYDPLDYIFGGCLANSNITFTAGTAGGWFRTTSGWWAAGDGLSLQDGVTANLIGNVSAPVVWARINTVQEQDSSAGYGPGGMTSYGYNGTPYQGATINANFTHCFMMNNDANHFRDDGVSYDGHLIVNANNCEFYGNIGGYYDTITLTNCLFFRSGVGILSDVYNSGLTLQNCTFYSHTNNDVFAEHWGGSTWPVSIYNCAFENCDLHDLTTNNLSCDYNSFRQGDQRLPILGTHDVIVTNGYNWQSSWLGDFYQPTNSPLINAGSPTANQIGLYHFTTQTNQVNEANSTVDIGYHYVATDAYGNPIDTNDDGVPDYLEDGNGNGLIDSGEIGWNIFGDLGLKVLICQPRFGTVLP